MIRTTYRRLRALHVLAAIAIALPASAVHAAPQTLYFQAITANDPSGGAVADGAANLRVEISDPGEQKVRFTFFNDSNVSSLTDVYFDDGPLLGIDSIFDSGNGVSFAQYASPANLPGGLSLTPIFSASRGFSADSDAPVSANGVQNSDVSGEWLTVDFTLKAGKTFADVQTALTRPAGGEWLRIGAHVQAFAGGYSESFVSAVATPVPEPGSHALFLAGLALLACAARCRKGANSITRCWSSIVFHIRVGPCRTAQKSEHNGLP